MHQISTKQIQYSNKMIKKIQVILIHLEMFRVSSRQSIKSLKVKKSMIKLTIKQFKIIK